MLPFATSWLAGYKQRFATLTQPQWEGDGHGKGGACEGIAHRVIV